MDYCVCVCVFTSCKKLLGTRDYLSHIVSTTFISHTPVKEPSMGTTVTANHKPLR